VGTFLYPNDPSDLNYELQVGILVVVWVFFNKSLCNLNWVMILNSSLISKLDL